MPRAVCGAGSRELKEAGITFILHVVGFDVSEQEREQLQCIADAGGGKYYSARNADQFDFAVSSAAAPQKKETSPAGCDGKVWFDKTPAVFVPGGAFDVNFEAAKTFHKNAWLGIIPKEIPHGNEDENDAYDLDYQYIGDRTTGVVSFTAPEKPGRYDFRLHDSNRQGNEIATVVFSVE